MTRPPTFDIASRTRPGGSARQSLYPRPGQRDWGLNMSEGALRVYGALTDENGRELSHADVRLWQRRLRDRTLLGQTKASEEGRYEIRAQWPVERDGSLALPGARADDADDLCLWYGRDQRTPAISFRRIELSEIAD